jgi:hypothetical protein
MSSDAVGMRAIDCDATAVPGPGGRNTAAILAIVFHAGVSFTVLLTQETDPDEIDAATKRDQKIILRTTWRTRHGVASALETEFTPSGRLREARSGSLVPVDNAVPSMQTPVDTRRRRG